MTPDALTPHFFTEFDKEARSRESRDPFCHDAVRLVEEYRAALNTITQQAQELEQAKGNYAIQKAAADYYEQQLAAMTRERDELNIAVTSGIRHRQKYVERIDSLVIELAASQARCREMETELQKEHERSTAHFDLCVHKDTELAQLQATLAAREAEIDRLKLAQQHSIQDECEAKQRLIRYKRWCGLL